MNINDISTQLLYTTLPLWVEKIDGRNMSGTAFIFMFADKANPQQSVPLLVTNFHVVENAKRGLIEFVGRKNDLPAADMKVKVQLDGSDLTSYIDQENDLMALPLGPVLNQFESTGQSIFFRSITQDLIPPDQVVSDFAAIEEITFIGYPSGLYDDQNYSPIVRRGITATPIWNDFRGKKAFLIDAGVFPGSSGSPVFLANQGAFATSTGLALGNRLHFLGILSESIVRRESPTNNVFLGLGQVTKASVIKSFLEGFLKKHKLEIPE